MNVLDHVVTKILSEPKFNECEGREYWSMDIEVSCYGRKQKGFLVFDTKEEAEKIEVGYVYQA